MKKIITILAVFTMLTATLTGCFSTDTESVKAKVDSSSSVAEEKQKEPKTEETVAEISAEEQVLWKIDGVKVIFKGIEENKGIIGDYKVNFLVENTSKNNYKLAIEEFSINDYSVSTFLYTEIKAGKKAEDCISIYESTLKKNDIDKMEKMGFVFRLLNTDTYKSVESEAINIYLE